MHCRITDCLCAGLTVTLPYPVCPVGHPNTKYLISLPARWRYTAHHSGRNLWDVILTLIALLCCVCVVLRVYCSKPTRIVCIIWTFSEQPAGTLVNMSIDSKLRKDIHMVLLCFVLLWLYHELWWVDLCGLFTHILQGYFTGTGAIIWLPQCQWSNPEGYG